VRRGTSLKRGDTLDTDNANEVQQQVLLKEFRQKLSNDFLTKRRARDLRELFTWCCRQHHPGLPIPWLKKHNALAKILYSTYEPDLLCQMIETYLATPEYSQARGVSFDSFYFFSQHIATTLITEGQRQVVIDQRRRQLEAQDAQEFKQLQHSDFFTRLPLIFQQKVIAATESGGLDGNKDEP